MKPIPAIAVIALLSGCMPSQKKGIAEVPLTDQQRVLATQATGELRYKFNNAACSAIFNDAGEMFQRLQRQEDWMADCAELRSALGTWQDFSPHQTTRFGQDRIFTMRGRASFEKAAREVELCWLLQSGKLKLAWINIQEGTRWRVIPALPRPGGSLEDVPPPGQQRPGYA